MNKRDTGALLLILTILPVVQAHAQGSPCLSNPDTAATHAATVTRFVTLGDSSRLVQQGIPYRPAEGVAVVTDTVICRAIVTAYNGLSSPDAADISRAYVLTVGTTAYAMVGEKTPSVYAFFDTSYHWLAGFAKM